MRTKDNQGTTEEEYTDQGLLVFNKNWNGVKLKLN
jgi:hypothetical protein